MLNVTRAEQMIVVHRLHSLSDGRLRVRWKLAYIDRDAEETLTPTDKPSTERVAANMILHLVRLDKQGVLDAKTTRALDNGNPPWRLEEIP